MLKSRAMSFLISFVIIATVIESCLGEERSKRQAPSINVHQIPKTSFSCTDRTVGEYYADPEVLCQVYHVCVPGMNNQMSLISFVCPNGTIFSQATRVCTPYDRVDCSLTTKFYDSINGQHDSARRESDYDTNDVPPPKKPSTQAPFRQQFRGTTQQPRAPARPAFRPTARAVVSTSTSTYNYEYEYDYEYEDEHPNADQPKGRSKRSPDLDEQFTCEGKLPGGAYADVESNCEMFHICVLLGKDKILDYKVSCGNGTAFDQEIGYCREKVEFACENAPLFYQYEKQKQSTKKLVLGKKKLPKSKKSKE